MILNRVVPIGDGSGVAIDRRVLTAAHVLTRNGNHVKDLRHTIGELSEYRENIADDESGTVFLVHTRSSDNPDLTPSLDNSPWRLGFPRVQTNDEPIQLASVKEDVVSNTYRAQPAVSAASSRATDRLLSRSRSGESTRDDLIWLNLSVCDLAAFEPWSRYAGAAVQPITLAQSFEYGCQRIVIVPCPPAQNLRDILGCRAFRLTFQEDALPTGSTAAFLRFIDGILAALRLMLVLVLTALSKKFDVLTFVLVMLAACLRYGRREEPDDHAFLPMRRNQTSLGWCPQG